VHRSGDGPGDLSGANLRHLRLPVGRSGFQLAVIEINNDAVKYIGDASASLARGLVGGEDADGFVVDHGLRFGEERVRQSSKGNSDRMAVYWSGGVETGARRWCVACS
jgi:hypothetical protein